MHKHPADRILERVDSNCQISHQNWALRPVTFEYESSVGASWPRRSALCATPVSGWTPMMSVVPWSSASGNEVEEEVVDATLDDGIREFRQVFDILGSVCGVRGHDWKEGGEEDSGRESSAVLDYGGMKHQKPSLSAIISSRCAIAQMRRLLRIDGLSRHRRR